MRYMLLEPLRGLAALWVFCFHFHFSESFQAACPRLHAVLKAGALGIPMFFVLSGYCITASAQSALRHKESTGSFLYRRLRRIYPPYWFSILVVISIPFLIELLSSLKTGRYTPPTPANLNYGFLNYGLVDWFLVGTLTQVFVPVREATTLQYKFTTINAVYWTLAIEVQFYLAVTLAIYLRRCYTVLLTVTAVSLPFLFVPTSMLVGVFLPFWPMFAVGVLLYWVLERGLAPSRLLRPSLWPLAWMCLVGLLVGFIFYLISGSPINHLAFAAGFALCLYLGEGLDRPFAERVLSSKRLAVRMIAVTSMSLGAMSYSLYLLHGRLQFLSIQVLRQVFPPNSIIFDLAVIAVTCVACFLFYHFCERPFMSSRQRKLIEPTLPLGHAEADRDPSASGSLGGLTDGVAEPGAAADPAPRAGPGR